MTLFAKGVPVVRIIRPSPSREKEQITIGPSGESARSPIIPPLFRMIVFSYPSTFDLNHSLMPSGKKIRVNTHDTSSGTFFRIDQFSTGGLGRCFVIGPAESSVIVVVAIFLFHNPLRESLAALFLGVLLFILSGLGVGLMISALVSTQQQGLLGAFLFLVPRSSCRDSRRRSPTCPCRFSI